MDMAPVHRPGQALSPAPAPIQTDRLAENREVIQAVRALNATELFGQNNELTFLLDRETQRAIIRLVDRKTKDILRQIPPEYVLRMRAEIEQQ